MICSGPDGSPYDCRQCDDEQREERNCHNRKKLKHSILVRDEWEQVPNQYHSHEVRKIDDLKFFECPLSAIRPATWDLLRQVNTCCNADGSIIHLPEPDLSILDQSPRFMAAVEIVRAERNSEWFREKQQKWAKDKAG